jgi:peptidyl-prolyl cis-trans isomerase D
MFAFLRKLIVPIMATVLVFFLITIVFEWGMNVSGRKVVSDTIGVINGEEITFKVFERYYSNLLRQEQDKVEDELPPDKVNEIKNKAWNQLLSDVLMNQEIEKHKVFVTDEEMYGFLRLYPPAELQKAQQFATDGKFDYQKYLAAMTNPEYTTFWASVESFVLPELKKYKLQEQIITTVKISPSEVMDAFLDERDSAKIGLINIPTSKFFQGLTPPSKDELKKYYNEHIEDFKVGKRATLSIVVFQKEASENDWEKVGYKIKEIYDSIMAGGDFAEQAGIFSEDPSNAEKGGDLGWFPRGRMVGEFDSVSWSLQINEVSRPFKTRFGWHIVKLLGKKMDKQTPPGAKEPQEMEMINAAHILLKVSPSQETLDQLSVNAKDFAEGAVKDGFEKAAKDYNYEAKTTKPFGEKDYIQFLGSNPDASQFTFSNEAGKVSDVMENSSGYFVIKVASHLPEGHLSYEEAERDITQKLNGEKAKEKAKETANTIYSAIKSGAPIAKAGEPYGFSYIETEMITRQTNLAGIGRSPEVLGTVFGMSYMGEISQPIQHTNGEAIIALLAKNSPNLDDFNIIQDSLKVVVLQKKQQDIYGRWFDYLVANSKIENYVDKFYGGSY